MPVELYGIPGSAPARIVRMTLEVLKVPYEYKIVNIMKGENKTPEYLEINPYHNVPALKDGDFVLNESRAIATYLVNKYGNDEALYPKDTKTRAIVDQRLYFDMGTFYHALGECLYPVMFRGAAVGQDKLKRLIEVVGWVDDMVKDGAFCAGGAAMTVADLALLATASTLEASAVLDLADYPNLLDWLARMKAAVPNYEVANGEGATQFGEWYKSAIKKD